MTAPGLNTNVLNILSLILLGSVIFLSGKKLRVDLITSLLDFPSSATVANFLFTTVVKLFSASSKLALASLVFVTKEL